MPISLKSTLGGGATLSLLGLGGGEYKGTIVLMDFMPGTRTWTVPEGISKIRAFVVGGGASGMTGDVIYVDAGLHHMA